ncbi:RluA family pseudouridine synthase [Buchnera aphidicola]|uniref:RluA family pseudouridine synthase n=1 Tax=Buchnera aphidicola TaxID=9 RepID=UPI001E2DE02E|nr:RluA family pseudouridine synthase [Buchnera aphidicola]
MNVKKNLQFIEIKKENIFLDIIFQDSAILILNKPPNLVVHLGYGHTSGTLLNALIFHYKKNRMLPRAGIVHRLDRNTSGLLVVARTIFAYHYMIRLFQQRKVIKEYDAIVIGRIECDGIINYPIRRNIYNRTMMAIGIGGKQAITYYKIITIFRNYTHVRIRIETGRMHQIRVHFSSIFHPVLGDHLYSRGIRPNVTSYSKLEYKTLIRFYRPALHSSMLQFVHPITFKLQTWTVSPPMDMIHLLHVLYSEDMK